MASADLISYKLLQNVILFSITEKDYVNPFWKLVQVIGV